MAVISGATLWFRAAPGEGPESLRVFGRLPVTDMTECTEAGVRKAWKEETAAGVCASGALGRWGFSAGA
jgi:hypothetical protein